MPPTGRRKVMLALATGPLVLAIIGVAVLSVLPAPRDRQAARDPGDLVAPDQSASAAAVDPLAFADPRERRLAAVTSPAPGPVSTRPSPMPAGGRPTAATPTVVPSTIAPTTAVGPGESQAATQSTPTPVAPADISASYATTSAGLLGYSGEITIKNDGGTPTAQWTVTVTVQSLAVVSGVSGATMRQRGNTATFTGDPIGAESATSFRFTVSLGTDLLGPKRPTACRVDGDVCAGI
jgi:hypothetical protein